MWEVINNWEVYSVIWVQQAFSSPFWDTFWKTVTRMAEPWVFVPIMLAVFACLGLKQSLKIGFIWGSAGLFSFLIKLATGRYRPFLVRPDYITVIGTYPSTSASTSGHTALGCAIAVALCVLIWKLKIHKSLRITLCTAAVLTFGLGVGFSRVYLGVHYPSDIIASFITAVPFYLLSVWLFKMLCKIKLWSNVPLPAPIKNGFIQRSKKKNSVIGTKPAQPLKPLPSADLDIDLDIEEAF